MNEGEQARDAGIAILDEQHGEWIDLVLEEIARQTRDGGRITADDIRHIPFPHPNCVGAAFRIARLRGLIELKEYKKSQTPSCHARVVGVWGAKEAA